MNNPAIQPRMDSPEAPPAADPSARPLDLLVVGHSQAHAISKAAGQFAARHPDRLSYFAINFMDEPYRFPFTNDGRKLHPNPVWVNEVRNRISSPDTVVCLYIGGSEYWRMSLTPGPSPFDFVGPEADDDQPLIGQCVPYDLVMRECRAAVNQIGNYAGVVRSVAPVRLLQVLPPPPVRDLSALPPRAISHMAGFLNGYPVSPAHFRLKVWRACARAMQQVCADLGVECLAVPADAMDADGFLRTELISDALHGNARWGELLLDQIMTHLSPTPGIA